MPIINYEDYYKPPKPQPKAPAKYYQPPKPKITPPPPKWNPKDPRNRGTNVNRPPDIRQAGITNAGDYLYNTVKDVGTGMWDFFVTNPLTAIGMGANWAGTQLGKGLESLWRTAQSQQDSGYPMPLNSPVSLSVPSFNTSREPARGAYGLPPSTNWDNRYTGARFWDTPIGAPFVRPTPGVQPDTSYMPNYPQPYAGLYTPWATVVMDKITSPTGSRMGGTSGITRMTDTGGATSQTYNGYLPFVNMPGGLTQEQITLMQKYGTKKGEDYDQYDMAGAYRRESLAELLARGAVDPWASDPYEIGGAGTDWGSQSQEETPEVGDTGGWGYGGWGGGSASYGASSGVNGYLPGTRAGYGANASSPRYAGGQGGRGSSYAGAQSANQASWRMPMLVWNI